jgi:hypothetical protein
MFISIIEGKAKVSKEGLAIPIVKKVYSRDKSTGKASFERWMRFIYYAYDKNSLYRNYLPQEREKKVVEMLFPDKTVTYFKTLPGMKELIEFYIESSYSFKELLYRRLLNDVEVMMDRLSKIELTKTTRVKGQRDVTFFSKTEKKEVTETLDLNVRVTIDNSEEKIKAMDTLDKLLKREVTLKKALKAEAIEDELKKASERRLFDK